jgi:PKHD-type hydroxylase
MERLYLLKNFIDKDDCEKIMSLCKETLTLEKARVGQSNEVRSIRKSSVAFIKNIEEVDNKLVNFLKQNIILKGFEVTGLSDYQFTEYGLGEYYDWHTDSSKEYNNRYYSVVIQLNDEYDGGILEIEDIDKKIIQLEKGVGNMCIFQSNLLHRVTPVNEGVRYSLVNWVSLNKIDSFKKTLI